jgi:uncharacterized membrane protein
MRFGLSALPTLKPGMARWVVIAGYIVLVGTGLLYSRTETDIWRHETAGFFVVIGASILAAVASLHFSRGKAPTGKFLFAARAIGWGAFIAGFCLIWVYSVIGTFLMLMWAWGERHQ